MDRKRLVRVALGEEPADLLLVNARVLNVFTAEVERAAVAVADGRVAGIGRYTRGREVVDVGGRYLVPGFIDGHIHLESTLLVPQEFARAVVPRGTLGVVADPHEVANVGGLPAVRFLIHQTRDLPLDFFFQMPSCVPASPLESAGAVVGPADVEAGLQWPEVLGLGEMMNFVGVLAGADDPHAKLAAARGRVIDGHAPGLTGRRLNAYAAAGPRSDHETTRRAEGRDKLRRGMFLFIREGSSAKNLAELLPLVTDRTYHRCGFVTDDRSCHDIMEEGHLDHVVNLAIRRGLNPIRAIQLASFTTAGYFRLQDIGAIAPGYWANFFITADLAEIRADEVFYRGRLVARGGEPRFETAFRPEEWVLHTVNLPDLRPEDLRLEFSGESFPAVEVVPDQIVTRLAEVSPPRRDGQVVADPDRDLAKLVVVERHHRTGRLGIGLVKGLGLKRGALASTIGHDAHNLIVAGISDADILLAIERVRKLQGGLVVVADGRVLGEVPLPVLGLLSPEPLPVVRRQLEEAEGKARELGCPHKAPFTTLSFLGLSVIPEARVTDHGVVDARSLRVLVPGRTVAGR
jgi:adenine deaminase